MKRSGFVLLLVLSMVVSLPAWAVGVPAPVPVNPSDYQTNQTQICTPIAGTLFTDIGFLPMGPMGTNLGQAWGDLAGPLAATILGEEPTGKGGFVCQHYWITSSGEKMSFNPGWLKPSAVIPFAGGGVDANLAAVRWGDYLVSWNGGTGKWADSKGYLDCFGLADFANLTLVLRYRGMVCHPRCPGNSCH